MTTHGEEMTPSASRPMIPRALALLALNLLPLLGAAVAAEEPAARAVLRPWREDPRYWEYEGRPVLLAGGTKTDHIFLIDDLEEHLDELVAAGGNYVRCTMSQREGPDLKSHVRLPDGRFDLERWNEDYWSRFARCLELAEERDVIIQIEVWDRFDFSQEHWIESPWRPEGNVNYTPEESGLRNRYPAPAWRDRQPFFHTVPGLRLYREELEVVRRHQERFVEKILAYSLGHPNVLYCMNNETSTDPRWGRYWMEFIRERARERGLAVYATDMFDDAWKPRESEKLAAAIADSEMYPFIDISQVNSRSFGEDHWRNLRWIVERAHRHPRPLNHVKIYGAGETRWGSGTPADGIERLWRNLIGGSAAVRFHRDGAGIGLQPRAKACLRAVREVESLVKFWEVEPHQELLGEREEDEAYLAAWPGEAYILYFTDGGGVTLDLREHPGPFRLAWIDISSGGGSSAGERTGGERISLQAPDAGGRVAVLRAAAPTAARETRAGADEPFPELPRDTWVKLSPVEGSPPSPRLGYEGACVWDSARGRLIRYGGHNQGGGGEQNAEVWTFDPLAARWELHEPNTSPPGVCCAQQNVFDPARARYVRFPAFSASHGWQWRREVWLNDSTVWTYDPGTETWRNMRPLPAPRVRPLRSASWDARHEVVVVFGGEGSREGTLVYDPYTNRWKRMRPPTEPAFRSAGNMAYDAARDVHVLFGSQFTDDPHTWTYDLRKNEWRDMRPESMPPTDRNDAVLAYDPVSRKVVALVKVTSGEGEDVTHRLETWAYDAGANRWEELEPSREPDPSGNRARCLVSAPELGGVLLENCTHPPHAPREQQIWFYRLGDPAGSAETSANGENGSGGGEPPRPPSDLRATTTPGAALLEWSASPSPDVARYVVFRGEGELPWEVELRPIAELGAGSRTYRDEEVERGTVLHYVVRAENAAGRKSPPSARARTQPRVVEDAAVSVLAADEVELSWTPPSGGDIAGYHIERAPVEVWSADELRRLKNRTPPLVAPSAGAIRRIGRPVRLTRSPVTETTYRDTGVNLEEPGDVEDAALYERSFPDEQVDANGRAYPFAVYAYRITAVNALGVESGPSPAFLTIPSAPRFVFSKEEGTTCRLGWKENPEKGLRGYRVYRMNGRYDSAKIARLSETPVPETRFADREAGERTRRYYVVAVDALGQEGFPSAPVWFEREWKRFYEPFTEEWHQ